MRLRWMIRGVLGLFLVTMIVLRLAHHHPIHGYRVSPVTDECAAHLRGDLAVGDLVLRIDDKGIVKLNNDQVAFEDIGNHLGLIYKVRRQHVLFLDIGDTVPFQTVADVMSVATSAAPDVRIVLVTPASRQSCLDKWASIPGAG